MLHNAVLCSDDKFFVWRFLCKIHDSCCRANIVRFLHNFLATFRMYQKKCIRMCLFCFLDIFCTDYDMSRTSSFVECESFFRKLLSYKVTKIRIRNKKDLVVVNFAADLNR